MPYVGGRVTVSETDRGVAGLVVAAVHVAAPPKDRLKPSDLTGERLGSVITDSDGRFSIEYDASANAKEKPAAGKVPRNLALVVTGPESSQTRKRLYVSAAARVGAGFREEFSIRIKAADLLSQKISVPDELADPGGRLTGTQRDDERELRLRRGEQAAARQRVAIERGELAAFESFRRAIVSHLSPAPGDLLRPQRHIDDPTEVIVKNRLAISDGVASRFTPNAPEQIARRALLHLDPDQVTLLRKLSQDGGGSLTADGYRQVLAKAKRKVADQPPTVLTDTAPMLRQPATLSTRERVSGSLLGEGRELPPSGNINGTPALADERRDSTAVEMPVGAIRELPGELPVERRASEASTDRRSASLTTPTTEEPPETAMITAGSIEDRLATLLGGITAPEDPFALSPGTIASRGDPEDVQATANAFALRPGPADVPALFDFHRLQIAFEHVWQEVVDEDVVEVAAQTHRTIRQLGGNPRLKPGDNPVRVLMREAGLVNLANTPFSTRNQAVLVGSDGGGGSDGSTGGRRLDLPGPSTHNTDEQEVYTSPTSLLGRLLAMIEQAYPFTIYGAEAGSRSVNFGLVATYRQTWTPVAYQVGRLISTLPLTPGEARRVTTRQVVRTKRAERSMNRWDSMSRAESNSTSRAEGEIIAKAQAKTNFELTTDGTYNLGVAKGDSTSKLGRDAGTDSSDTKRNFREAVIKAVHEYKQEHSTEVTTDDSSETEQTNSYEIKNDNNELYVTFLFYELQRRYRLHERLHRVSPVVLVAQEVPNPSQITDAWVIAHDWIIRRVLLDERLLPAMDYIADKVAGDELALAELGANVTSQRALVTDLQQNMRALETQATRRYEAMLRAVEERAQVEEDEDTDGFFSDVGQFFGGDGQSTEAARIREEMARDAQQHAVDQVKELQVRLQREITALNEITERYAKLRSDHRNREVQIARLRLHVRQNILYYMQAIWSFEVPHQRSLRLHQVRVPSFGDSGTTYTPTGDLSDGLTTGVDPSAGTLETAPGFEVDVVPNLTLAPTDDLLEEVADLDQLLGFHGNYMVFPLKEHNPLTEFLSAPYIDSGWRLIDPDEPEAMTLEEFSEYVQSLHDRLSMEEFAKIKEALRKKYAELINSPLRQGEEIVVPTDSLYIDALPGTRPLLEDFKLLHRGVDVRAAQARVRQAEIENLRFAARLASDELEDPEVDKRIVVEGQAAVLTSDG